MKKNLPIIAFFAFAMFLAKPANAAISNGNFEHGPKPGSQTRLSEPSTKIDDWKVISGNIDYIGSYWQAASGKRSVELNGSKKGTIRHTFPTVDGATYYVAFSMSGNPTGGPDLKKLTVRADGMNSKTFFYDTDKNDNTRKHMRWKKRVYEFVAIGDYTKLTFSSANSGSKGPALDNVRVFKKFATSKKYSSDRKDECKKGGWTTIDNFKNQGDCVSWFQSNKKSNLKSANKWIGKKWKDKKKKKK